MQKAKNAKEFGTEAETQTYGFVQEARKIVGRGEQAGKWPKTFDRWTDPRYGSLDNFLKAMEETGHTEEERKLFRMKFPNKG